MKIQIDEKPREYLQAVVVLMATSTRNRSERRFWASMANKLSSNRNYSSFRRSELRLLLDVTQQAVQHLESRQDRAAAENARLLFERAKAQIEEKLNHGI